MNKLKSFLTQRNNLLLVLILFLTIAGLFHFSSPNIVDSDSFYYIRQAWLYRTQGLFTVDFPWIQFSVIKDLSSSLWYGFGILLIPFTLFNNLALGIKVAGVLLTALALFAFYWSVGKQGFRWKLLWPLLFFFSAPNVLGQLLMVRPQIISLALIPVLFSSLIFNNLWISFAASFGIVFAHLNFAWAPLLVAGVVFVCKFITEKYYSWKGGLVVIGGALLGWLLRPEPISAIKLFYIQVFQQILEKQGGLPLLFGKENLPLTVSGLFQSFFPLLIALAAAIILLFWLWQQGMLALSAREKTIILSSGVLAFIFFIFTMIVARRAYNFWAEFSVLFIAAVFSYCLLSQSSHRQKNVKSIFTLIIGSVFIFTLFYSGIKAFNAIDRSGYPPDRLKEAALWLRDNSQPGDIVFNVHWPDFSPLFFWNQKNYYIGGLDPIFQYSYDPALYWKFHYLSADQVTSKTCGAIACTDSMLEDTYEVLVKDFNAKYVLLDKIQNPAVNLFLSSSPNFEKKIESKDAVVYSIKR